MIVHITPHTIQIDPISSALSSLSASSFSSLVASLDEIVRKDLEAFRAVFFWCLVGATVAVVIGVILEEAQDWMPTAERVLRLDPIAEYRWAKKLVKLGWILIVVGVAGEGIFEVYVSRTDSLLSTFDNILLTEARREASDAALGAATANRQIAEARQRAAELERQAAQLQKDAEDERLARVKIEARVAWRRLTEQQKEDIGNRMKRFSNQGVSFWSNAGDVEASWFAADIAEAIAKAETLRVYAPAQFISAMEGGHANLGKPIRHADTGVVVGYTPDAPSQLLSDAIVKELTTRGFDAMTRKNESKEPIAPQVAVQVEARPEGPQGEFKIQAAHEAKAKNRTQSSP
jgi:hypothetical protein